MPHLMTNGRLCGIASDNHRGHCRSAEAVENDRMRHRNWIARYRLTARGMLADVKHHANERVVI